MRVLFDTHTLIWWWLEDERLNGKLRNLIESENTEVVVSAATAWEIATKYRLGKLPELAQAGQPIADLFRELIGRDRFVLLPISHEHGLRSGGYDAAHRDPFDRLLAAQSELGRLPLVTRDPAFAAFPCETLW